MAAQMIVARSFLLLLRKVQCGELAKMSKRKAVIIFGSFDRSSARWTANSAIVDANSCVIRVAIAPITDAPKTRLIWTGGEDAVGYILASCCYPKIVTPVVQRVAIYVINILIWRNICQEAMKIDVLLHSKRICLL